MTLAYIADQATFNGHSEANMNSERAKEKNAASESASREKAPSPTGRNVSENFKNGKYGMIAPWNKRTGLIT